MCSGHRAEEFLSVLNSSVLLVQADEGVLIPVVDLIRRIYRRLQFKSQISLRILVGARRLDASKVLVGFGPAVGRCAWRSHRFCEAAAMLTWTSDVGVLARIQLFRVISCWYVSCDDHGVAIDFARCVLVGSSSNADVDFRRWCISTYPAVPSDQLLPFVVVLTHVYQDAVIEYERQYRARHLPVSFVISRYETSG
ncbi:hypothetical protein F511_20609 [Dorcoceras hygrometricum]|uniref:Uncharacterized protein n=1 Tax=Dorcoceras hygrometricum TaxID=472368 RepID=A0A2Z7A518_9LAMI|nr:hypothetical protein F511_20609 [Dorcoceras hygrometricum]